MPWLDLVSLERHAILLFGTVRLYVVFAPQVGRMDSCWYGNAIAQHLGEEGEGDGGNGDSTMAPRVLTLPCANCD
jgi:hypothetical protein